MLLVKVNATSANVCVGFDVLGLALNIRNEFRFKKTKKFSFKGFEQKYCYPTSNMVFKAYKRLFEYLNKELIPVEITFKGDIPVSRGLGSSSSLIVGGLVGANAILGNPLSKEELFNLACEIEGHPDNVAPAVYGGLIASYKTEDGVYKPISYRVSKDLKFVVIIPPFKLSTKEARKALPKVLPYADIVNNLSRIVNVPYAFTNGDLELIKKLFIDMIHEPYRKALINEYEDVKRIAEKNDACLAISGSGSTMLIISNNYDYEKELLDNGYNFKRVNIGSGVKVEE